MNTVDIRAATALVTSVLKLKDKNKLSLLNLIFFQENYSIDIFAEF